jgi:hypothetical protein
MNKPELIKIALDQLLDQFKLSPESFDYHEDVGDYSSKASAILWEPKIELNGDRVDDPNQYKAIVITFKPKDNEMACHIFTKSNPQVGASVSRYDLSKSEACTKYTRRFETFRNNYRKFKKLANLITQRDRRNENKAFLMKLYGLFPATMDKHLFGE